MTALLDTNLIIRYLVEDDPRKADAVERLLAESKEKLLLLDLAFAEIVWVLQSYYGLEKNEIVEKLGTLLTLKSIKTNKKLLGRTLDFFAASPLNFVDAYQAAYTTSKGLDLYSYDKDFDKVAGLKRLEP